MENKTVVKNTIDNYCHCRRKCESNFSRMDTRVFDKLHINIHPWTRT